MRARNQRIYSADQEYLRTLAEELRFAGRDVDVFDGYLISYALPKKHKKSKKTEPKEETKRNQTKRERWYGKARD